MNKLGKIPNKKEIEYLFREKMEKEEN